ncbi:MAG: hypothetical protein HY466_07855, partial [Deltaproteobacteria bacterium]|nr:hypothetical protein [Deltaproteobacteria bacterium]
PVLGDIPILGFLFRQTDDQKSKSNLMLFITPHIIRDSSDFSKVLQRKVGQTSEFMTRNFKPKEKSDIETVIHGHNADIADILAGRPGPGALAPLESGKKEAAAGESVITAEPEEEPLTIVIPKDEKAAKMLEKKAMEEAKQQAEEEKKRKKQEEEAGRPPLIEVPSQASPPQEAQAAPAPREDHPPVITLPPGGAPNWEE